MPSPLSILGGLMTAGAQGVAGGLEGKVEAEKLRRQYLSEDQKQQMNALEMMLKQQQIAQGQRPDESVIGGYIYRKSPLTGALTPVGPALRPPPTELDISRQRGQEALTGLHRAQAGQVGKPPGYAEWAAAPGNQGKSYMDFVREQAQATARPPAPSVSSHYATDARGHVTQVITRTDPATGQSTTAQVPLGPIGKPQAAVTPQETLTQTTRITPRRPITNFDDMARLNTALPAIVTEITAQFAQQGMNFDVPGAWVKLPSGRLVRKEEVIAEAIKLRLGVEATVTWEGPPAGGGWLGSRGPGRFVITKAWEPAQREPLETRRRVGPPSGARGTDQDEEE